MKLLGSMHFLGFSVRGGLIGRFGSFLWNMGHKTISSIQQLSIPNSQTLSPITQIKKPIAISKFVYSIIHMRYFYYI